MAEAIKQFDLLVLGGGPGGYVAAIRAAQLGLKVCVADEQPLGGVCVNWGCIPSKALLKTAEYYQDLKEHIPNLGIQVELKGIDWQRVMKRSREVSQKNSGGVEFIVKKSGITRLDGWFKIAGDKEIEVYDKETRTKVIERVKAKHVIIATGGKNRELPGAEIDKKQIISFYEALSLEKQPSAMTVIGAGAIGIEFAYFYSALGTKVTVIEMLPNILPLEDSDSSSVLKRSLEKMGIEILTSTKVESVTKSKDKVTVKTSSEKGNKEFSGDVCLVAIGFQANLDGWGFEKTGVALEKGFIKVDKFYQTNKAGYYAIGDVIGAPQLAHVASHEAIICVEKIAGKNPHAIDYTTIPGCTYCQPQVASVGYTEQKCKELNLKYRVGKVPFTAVGKANAVGHTEGFVKLIFDSTTDELLGAHIVGSEATELIAELCVAKALETTSVEIMNTVHAHPTLSEGVMEAAAASHGESIHFISRQV